MKFAKAIPRRAPSRFVVATKRHRVKLMTEVAQTALWPVTWRSWSAESGLRDRG